MSRGRAVPEALLPDLRVVLVDFGPREVDAEAEALGARGGSCVVGGEGSVRRYCMMLPRHWGRGP